MFQNLTKHAISVLNEKGEVVSFAPSGVIATVETTEEAQASIGGFQIARRTMGSVKFSGALTGSMFLVSSMVLDAIDEKNASAFFAPDSGITAVRDEKGHVRYVTRLVTK